MRILVCGDRNWKDKYKIKQELSGLSEIAIVIEGEAPGADSLARDAAIELGLQVMKFPANWDKYGKAAGPIRNKQMLDEGKPDQVWAFHDDIAQSKGTKNMMAQAKARGIPTILHSH